MPSRNSDSFSFSTSRRGSISLSYWLDRSFFTSRLMLSVCGWPIRDMATSWEISLKTKASILATSPRLSSK